MRTLPIVAMLVLALCGCERSQPNPSLRDDEADAFVKSAHAWSQGLTDDGELLGHLLLDIVDGKTNDSTSFDTALLAFEEKLDRKIEELESSDLPKIRGVSKYRDLFVDYLTWQKSTTIGPVRQAVLFALDRTLSRAERAQKVAGLLMSLSEEELAWKDSIDVVIDEIYANINSGSEQGGADQPATDLNSRPKGGEKLKAESEERYQ